MRYEVRIYNLEEFIPENRMSYIPCDGRRDAVQKYLAQIERYNDPNHEVELCAVEYLPWGESVRVCASTRNESPMHVVWEEEWLEWPSCESECEGCQDDGPCGSVDPYGEGF